jgi:hypothetical protein
VVGPCQGQGQAEGWDAPQVDAFARTACESQINRRYGEAGARFLPTWSLRAHSTSTWGGRFS